MILFSNDKEIIFKITNAVLLIWFIAAVIFTCSSIINLVVPEPTYNYNEYKAANCTYVDDSELTKDEQDANCLTSYNSNAYYEDTNRYYDLVALYTSIANVVIVGGVLFFLNRKTAKKTKVK